MITEAYSEPSQTSKMDVSVEIVYGFCPRSLTGF